MLGGEVVGTVADGMAAMADGVGVDLVSGLEPACWSALQQLPTTAVITAPTDTMVGNTTTVITRTMPPITDIPPDYAYYDGPYDSGYYGYGGPYVSNSYSNYRRPYYRNGGYYARAHSYRSGSYARTNSRDGASYARANTRAGGSYVGANIRGDGSYARANAREGGSYGARPQHVRNSTTHHQAHRYER